MTIMENGKFIRIYQNTKDRLSKEKYHSESFDSVINRVLDRNMKVGSYSTVRDHGVRRKPLSPSTIKDPYKRAVNYVVDELQGGMNDLFNKMKQQNNGVK